MVEIVTAEEYIKNNLYITKDDIESVHDSLTMVIQCMQEFTKFHVQAALKSAAEKGKTKINDELMAILIDKQSILNAYPLDNIK